MDSRTLDQFLRSVERKAFVMAEISTRNRDDALDVVQDAMLKFASKYADRQSSEWKPLFYRVLQNQITDHHRRHQVKRKIFGFFGFAVKDEDASELTADDYSSVEPTPEESLQLINMTGALNNVVGQLALRQQQAFLLRNWEGMSVKETAVAMQCSEGSVKTHLSRAMAVIRPVLEQHI